MYYGMCGVHASVIATILIHHDEDLPSMTTAKQSTQMDQKWHQDLRWS